MTERTTSRTREIISDFANEIKKRKRKSVKPKKTVIHFRTEDIDRTERDIVKVPIELLRFRKENGRIASDVYDYENTKGPLNEYEEEGQNIIRKFLEGKDLDKAEELRANIQRYGQNLPAIITCDGFIINGNRRKMVIEQLRSKYPQEEKFKYMNVVILPGKDDEGGPPTLLDIERIENKYQHQSEGKSEYYGFDKALSIRRKIEVGLSLEEQIKDDPLYANESEAKIKKAINKHQKEYLKPLECIDRYLKQFQREKQYHTVSAGIGDPEGRWQAFVDYSHTYETKFKNENQRIKFGIQDDEIGAIEEAAFNIIRLRTVPAMPKVHKIMMDLHKYCGNHQGKKEILEIHKNVDPLLPIEEQFKDLGQQEPLSREEVDARWSSKNKETIIFHLKRAEKNLTSKKVRETPIELLDAALKKLTHDDMELSAIAIHDYRKARDLIVAIREEVKQLEHEIYDQKKNLDALVGKG